MGSEVHSSHSAAAVSLAANSSSGRGDSPLGLGLIWVLSLLPIWAVGGVPIGSPGGPGVPEFGDTSRCAIVGLIWLALVGLPRRRRLGAALAMDLPAVDLPAVDLSAVDERRKGGAFGRSLLPVGMAAPVLVYAFYLDHLAGVPGEPGAAVEGLLAMLATIWLLTAAAQWAAVRGRARIGWHAGLWLVLVPGLPLLSATLSWGRGGGGLPFGLDHLAQASPLSYAFGLASGDAPAPYLPLALGLLLLAVGLSPSSLLRSGEGPVRSRGKVI